MEGAGYSEFDALEEKTRDGSPSNTKNQMRSRQIFETDVTKQELLCLPIIILFCGSTYSKERVIGILDDISRNTYEKKTKELDIDNLGDPAYEVPPAHDQYQREGKKLISTRKKYQLKQKMTNNCSTLRFHFVGKLRMVLS